MVKKESNNTLLILITAAIGILIMVALIASLATQTNGNTGLTLVTNETVSIASARNSSGQLNTSKVFYPANYVNSWQSNGDVPECQIGVTGFSLINSSGSTMVNGTNYALSPDGSFTLLSVAPLNGTTTSNTTYITYDYCGSGYVSSSWGRTLLGVTIGILAIGVLIVALLVTLKLLNKSED